LAAFARMSTVPDTSAPSITLTCQGRLDNLPELRSALAADAPTRDASLADWLLAGWRRWGEALPEHLLGDFAFVLHDSGRGTTFLARDPLGVKPLYYTVQQGRLSHAFSVAELRKNPALTLTPDPDWMAKYLLHLSMSNTHTGYREVFKVPPGHTLTYVQGQEPVIRQYHHWQHDAPWATRRDPQWVDRYRDILEESIRCRMDDSAPMGTENSGGIDSATITAYLAHFLGEPGDRLYSFGFATCEQEPAMILATSQARRIVHNYLITTRPPAEDWDARVDHTLGILGYPEEHGNGSGHTPFYEEGQRKGIRTLYSGFGGDEVVTHPGYHLRWELLDRHRYGALWDILPGNAVTRTLRMGKAAVVGRRKPDYNPRFLEAWNARWPHQLLKPDVVDRLGLYDQYMETARYDAPYRRINDFILQGLLTMPYIATRLENCTLMAAAYGIDYRWPLWDVRLVQQYLSTPSIEKVGPRGVGRYLHRRAIDHIVPKQVAWKPSKDMGYGAAIQDLSERGLQQTAVRARALAADLHPSLVELIDPLKLAGQIKQAIEGKADLEFAFTFMRSVGALHQLDRWLKSHHP
jgi:Asparagine synthase (glutamine-hydrolyzing)